MPHVSRPHASHVGSAPSRKGQALHLPAGPSACCVPFICQKPRGCLIRCPTLKCLRALRLQKRQPMPEPRAEVLTSASVCESTLTGTGALTIRLCTHLSMESGCRVGSRDSSQQGRRQQEGAVAIPPTSVMRGRNLSSTCATKFAQLDATSPFRVLCAQAAPAGPDAQVLAAGASTAAGQSRAAEDALAVHLHKRAHCPDRMQPVGGHAAFSIRAEHRCQYVVAVCCTERKLATRWVIWQYTLARGRTAGSIQCGRPRHSPREAMHHEGSVHARASALPWHSTARLTCRKFGRASGSLAVQSYTSADSSFMTLREAPLQPSGSATAGRVMSSPMYHLVCICSTIAAG